MAMPIEPPSRGSSTPGSRREPDALRGPRRGRARTSRRGGGGARTFTSTLRALDTVAASGAQRFFLSWAQAWQIKARDEEVIRLLAIDPHSPNEFRCNQIVRNIDDFYTAFAVTPDDALWLEPKERVTIW